VDENRREELQGLFARSDVHIVFVTAFETRRTMQTFASEIAWESEVWIAEDPDHMIHFNGKRFLGPYPDVMPKKPKAMTTSFAIRNSTLDISPRPTTRRLAIMNLAMRGIEADVQVSERFETFRETAN